MLNFIKERFQIRQCRKFKNNQRACLNYHIKKCLAPCMGYVSKEEYRKQIDQIIMLLEGKTQDIIKQLDKEIIEEVGAVSIKDMGKVMKAAKEKIGAAADGKAINEVVRELLN